MKTENPNRARLLNIAAGGNGHVTPWIERIAYDGAPADAQQYGYVVHLPQHAARGGGVSPALHVHVGSIDAARGLLHAIATGAQPCSPDTTAEEAQAACDAIPYTDSGRHEPYDSRA